MGLFARTDKFGVVQANHLLTGGYNRVDALGETEVRVKLVDGDYVWYIMVGGVEKVIEKTRSIGRNYHGCDVIDENNYIMIPLMVDAAHTSVKLKLWGLNFPTFHYTELPAHDHDGQAFATTAHIHTVAGHVHPVVVSVWASYEDISHNHNYILGSLGGSQTSAELQQHRHAINWTGDTGSATPATGVPSATTAIPSQGINGGALNDTQKTVVDNLIKVYITIVQGTWGTAKDKDTHSPVEWSSLASINNNGGTDEIDIFSYLTAGSFNYIKIEEPTAKKGGKIAWHLSLS